MEESLKNRLSNVLEDDINDLIIDIYDYIGELCNWGDNIDVLTAPQKHFYVCQVFETEVNNGGISQFIFNSGHYAADVLEALKVIGAANVYKILHCAADKFPEGMIPLNDDEREAILEKIEDSDDQVWEALDHQFYEYNDDLNALHLRYIQQNIEDF